MYESLTLYIILALYSKLFLYNLYIYIYLFKIFGNTSDIYNKQSNQLKLFKNLSMVDRYHKLLKLPLN